MRSGVGSQLGFSISLRRFSSTGASILFEVVRVLHGGR